MITFIDHIAKYLIENYNQKFSETAIVFPNRRAGLYLRKSLGNRIDKPVVMPRVLSIEDFIYSVTGFNPIETVYLQFELYQVYQRQAEKNAQSFADFIKWGEVVLKEFNELDLALANPNQLFNYLTETKAISMWNPEKTPLTAFQQNYLQFYNSLGNLYHELRDQLVSKNQPYQGLAYRLLAEKWKNSNPELPWKHVLFAGFSALTNAEEKIFLQLEKDGLAEFIWDWDIYYADDPVQEAGFFVRRNRNTFKQFRSLAQTNHFYEQPKKIEVIGVPQRVGQAKIAGALLKKLVAQGLPSTNTAIILNDEALAMPLLNALPENTGSFNITMGLPLEQTPMAKLLLKVLVLQENALKLRRHPAEAIRFYYKDVLALLENSYFMQLLEISNMQLVKPINDFRASNNLFLGEGEVLLAPEPGLFNQDNNHLGLIFTDWNNQPVRAIQVLKMVVHKLKALFNNKQYNSSQTKLNIEYLFHVSKLLVTLESMVVKHDFITDLKTFKIIYSQLIKSIKLPFYGEPLKGVQVMGMLESRTLDFENLILLSVNEGHLPAAKPANSFIPNEIKRAFGIPVYDEHNAVIAYHFYRLLQRASNVFLIYNTEPDNLGGGDKSRFIMQLLHELPAKSPLSSITEKVVDLSAGMEVIETPIEIAKSEQVLLKLKQVANKGFSASSLNSYLKCSLQFYFKHVEGIKEHDEPEETIEVSTIGTVIHDVLCNMYKPYLELEVSETALLTMKKNAANFIRKSFEKNYRGGDIDHGKNLLILKVAESYIQNFLQYELKQIQKNKIQPHIIALESKFETMFKATLAVGDTDIKLKGYIDRVDTVDGKTRIIDYKTGRVNASDLKVKSWDLLTEQSRFDKSFQLLFYKYLFEQKHPGSNQPESGIISLRNISHGFMKVVEPEAADSASVAANFEEVLQQLFSKLFDPAVAFAQTQDTIHCKYCTFNDLCNRQ